MALRLQTEIAKTQMVHVNKAKEDIEACLQSFQELKPVSETYYSNDGRNETLLCLKGTVRCTIKGALYHIPVRLWLNKNHPYQAPLCFVDPSQGSNLQVTPSIHVLSSGQIVNHACIDQWHPDSGLYLLVTQLVSLFSYDCPIHSTPSGGAGTNYQQPQQPQPSYGVRQSQYSASYSNAQPQYAPQPQYGGQYNAQPQYGGQSQYNSQAYNRQSNNSQASTPRSSYNTPQAGYKSNDVEISPPYSRNDSLSSQQSSQSRNSSAATQRVTQPEPDISADFLRQSAVEAAKDKVIGTLKRKYDVSNRDIQKAQQTSLQLNERSTLLGQTQMKLAAAIEDTTQAVAWYNNAIAPLDASIAKMTEQATHFNVDEAVLGSHLLYDQMIDLRAEGEALEETIYNVKAGFTKNRHPPTSNLKNVMEVIKRLSEEKFEIMELHQKAMSVVESADRKSVV